MKLTFFWTMITHMFKTWSLHQLGSRSSQTPKKIVVWGSLTKCIFCSCEQYYNKKDT